MRLDVLAKVVAPHEPFQTLRAHKSHLPCVCSKVTPKLVRTSEAFATIEPVADKRLLPSVPPEVSPEVRYLSIDLSTVGIMAGVLLLASS